MRTTRNKRRLRRAPFGFAIAIFALVAGGAGYQAIASFLARHPIPMPVAGLHAATFSFPQPIGSEIPDPRGYQLASLQTSSADFTGSIQRVLRDPWDGMAFSMGPMINRAAKGDRLVKGSLKPDTLAQDPASARQLARAPDPILSTAPQESAQSAASAKGDRPTRSDAPAPKTEALAKGDRLVPAHSQLASKPEAESRQEAARETPPPAPATNDQVAMLPAPPPSVQTPTNEPSSTQLAARPEATTPRAEWPIATSPEGATVQTARLYFGVEGSSAHVLEPWGPGEEPVLMTPLEENAADAKPPVSGSGETIAAKGEVTGADQRPKSPTELLRLTDKEREKSEKCLTDAMYFEARGEPVRGQMAVAQVVMNRVFSGYYPNNVCGVVYQNKERHLGCQFTFACDGIPEVVNEPDAYERAKQIARDTLDGKLWLPEIGKATHYHAYWVRPSWVHEMFKLNKIGVHTFYRPRNWGDGAEAPVWGDAATTAEEAKKL